MKAASRRWTRSRRATRKKTDARTLGEVIEDADVFLGLSAGGVLKPEMVAKMAPAPADHGAGQPDPGDHCRN
jgi:malic enzyme